MRSVDEQLALVLSGAVRPSPVRVAIAEAYGLLVDDGAVTPIPGAGEAIDALRAAGVKVALTSGFARTTQDATRRAIEACSKHANECAIVAVDEKAAR